MVREPINESVGNRTRYSYESKCLCFTLSNVEDPTHEHARALSSLFSPYLATLLGGPSGARRTFQAQVQSVFIMTGYGSDVYKAPRPSPLEERAKTNFPAMLVVNDSLDNVSRNKSCGFVHIQHHILTHDGASLATCCYLQADFIKDAVPMSALHRSSVRSRFGCDCPRADHKHLQNYPRE